ncbi:MAG: TRAP transporter small permease [Pseudomonadota bacterium]
MRKVLDFLSRASLFISAISLVAMTVIISYQVVARYFFNDSPAWSERLALVLMAYLVFFGAAAGVHERFHIRIDAVRNAVPAQVAKVFDIVAHAAVMLAGITMVIASWQLTTTLWAFDIPALGLPRGIALLPLFISGALISLFAFAQLLDVFKQDSEQETS